jgi:Protein of unknown function (DUF2721)
LRWLAWQRSERDGASDDRRDRLWPILAAAVTAQTRKPDSAVALPNTPPLVQEWLPALADEERRMHGKSMFGATNLSGAAHIVQLALTPIFLLTGLASLLNVFTTRLGRIADRVDRLAGDASGHSRQLSYLRLRSLTLDVAVLLTALAGALTCCAALTLFLGALRNTGTGYILLAFFGSALVCAVAALVAFGFETILSGRSVREQARPERDRQENPERDR